MSYRFTRMTGFKTIANMMEAMPTCIKIVEYINKVWKMEAHLMVPMMGGHPGRVRFAVLCDDLNALQAAQSAAMKDKKYLALLGKLGPHVDGSVTHDQMWNIIA